MLKRVFKKIIVAIITLEARLILRKYKPKVVAITGNVGKTSTKDAIYSVLKNVYYVRKSEKSFNSNIGVPLTVLGVPSAWSNPLGWMKNILEGLALIFLKNHYPKWLVLEVGADSQDTKSITKLSKWLKTDMVVMTAIGETPVHVEFFGGADEVAREKSQLIKTLQRDGILILDADSERALALAEISEGRKILTYGFGEKATLRATHEQVMYDGADMPAAINFKVDYGSSSVPVQIGGTASFAYAYAALAALACGVSEGVNLINASQWLSSFEIPPGRMKIIEGVRGSKIFDDTYNSAPAAMRSAVKTLTQLSCGGRKIAVLGDMMELGKYSVEEHKKIGALVADGCDMLVAVGTRAKEIAKEAHKHKLLKKHILTFDTAKEAGKKLKDIIQEKDIILVKGAQSMRMERVVEQIMAHPEMKQQLLVRQDKEWLARS